MRDIAAQSPAPATWQNPSGKSKWSAGHLRAADRVEYQPSDLHRKQKGTKGSDIMDSIEAKLNQYQPQILSIFRIVFALLILQHGCAKWFGFPVAGPPGASFATLIGWAGILELVFGSLLTVGLFTRLAAFILSGEMAFAYWMGHAPRAWTPIGNNGS